MKKLYLMFGGILTQDVFEDLQVPYFFYTTSEATKLVNI
jgi:hypothetical protein